MQASRLSELTQGLGVRLVHLTLSLVHKTLVVLDALLAAADASLLLLCGGDLRGLVLHLSGTCKGSVDLSHFKLINPEKLCVGVRVGKGEGKGKGKTLW